MTCTKPFAGRGFYEFPKESESPALHVSAPECEKVLVSWQESDRRDRNYFHAHMPILPCLPRACLSHFLSDRSTTSARMPTIIEMSPTMIATPIPISTAIGMVDL